MGKCQQLFFITPKIGRSVQKVTETTKTFLLDILNLIKFYNKEIIIALLVTCLICFIRIYIEFIRIEKIQNKKAKILKHQETLRRQQEKNLNIIKTLETF